ncbi:MAG: hypothetical protein PHC64_06270 [Candidatus Gastranaerophilales bacterium]|nr:hypothetical protein [Candidatus Gastranaerophilales bacterium]
MLAIKFYSSMPENNINVLARISGAIPAEVICNTNTVPDETYTLMTYEEYVSYLVSISEELQAWKVIQDNIEEQIGE